jgi:hypothetical protein
MFQDEDILKRIQYQTENIIYKIVNNQFHDYDNKLKAFININNGKISFKINSDSDDIKFDNYSYFT